MANSLWKKKNLILVFENKMMISDYLLTFQNIDPSYATEDLYTYPRIYRLLPKTYETRLC